MTELTEDDNKKLIRACKLVKEVFPNLCGNIRFNLHPEREKVNCNVGYSIIIDPEEYHSCGLETSRNKV